MSHNSRPRVKISVVERQNSISRGKICRDEIDIEYHPEVLTAFFFRRPTNRVIDLLRIAAAVAHADRRVTRRHSVCWGRDLALNIPVSDPDFWFAAEKKLSALLNLLSGDCWSFSFRLFKGKSGIPQTGYLEFPPNGEISTAYSNGLDSFSVARLVASGTVRITNSSAGSKNLILVTTGRKLHLDDSFTQFGYTARQISVPFTVARQGKAFQLRETSYRTRGFVFQTLAALAAAQSESNLVIVGEAGQGSLGPWLTLTGNEAPDLRTHPYFTKALQEFLSIVLERNIRFEHPFLWDTKAEVLKRLVSANLHEGWAATHSCAVQARHLQSAGPRLQCGLCPNCLLRRQSLLAAGLNDALGYDFSSLSEDESSISLQRRAAQGLMPLVEFARMKENPITNQIFIRELTAFADRIGLDNKEVQDRGSRLVDAHAQELRRFLAMRPSKSILRQLGEAFL